MTFLDLQTLVKNRVNYTDSETTVLNIIKNAINYAYISLFTMAAKKTKSSTLTLDSADFMSFDLPADFHSAISVNYDSNILDKLSYNVDSDVLIIDKYVYKTGLTPKLLYIYEPPALSADGDTVNLNAFLTMAVSAYGAYAYYAYKKKTDMAMLISKEFENLLQRENLRIREGGAIEFSGSNKPKS